MNLQNITPNMTSNTSPAPYVVYSSTYDNTNDAKPYKAFNKIAFWAWSGGVKNAWLDLWFNEYTVVDYINIVYHHKSTYTNRVYVYGTNDRKTYDLIHDTGTYSFISTLEIKIPRSKYKCYRLYFIGSQQNDAYVKHQINNIYFYKDLDISDPSEQIKSIVTDIIKNHELIKNHILFKIQN